MPKPDKGKMVVVAIDISKQDMDIISGYEELPASEKINRITNRIEAICQQLQEKEPEGMWIVAWREYGISEANSKYASTQTKFAFLEAMRNLTERYPQLAIVGGTMAVTEHFNKNTDVGRTEKLSRVKEKYDKHRKHRWVFEKEKNPDNPDERGYQQQMHLHQEKAEAIFTDIKEGKFSSTGIDVVKNVCYVIQGGTVQKKSKTTPFQEVADRQAEPHSVFEPGKARKKESPFILAHPVSGEKITLGIEICREHDLGYFKAHAKKEPDLHLVLSDTSKIELENIHGKYAIHLDSVYKPKLILSDEDKDPPVSLYQHDLLKEDMALRGPLELIYPFEKRVVEILDLAMSKIPETGGSQKTALEMIKKNFLEQIADTTSNEILLPFLLEKLEQLKATLKMPVTSKVSDAIASRFFKKSSSGEQYEIRKSVLKTVKTLEEMVFEEQKKHPERKDISERTDMPEIQLNTTSKRKPIH